MSTRLPFVVEYDDGSTVSGIADQRDFCVFEAAEGMDISDGNDKCPSTLRRTLAHSFLRRTAQIDSKTNLAVWGRTVVEVRFTTDKKDSDAGAPEDDPPALPGQTATSDAKPSRSRSRVARAS